MNETDRLRRTGTVTSDRSGCNVVVTPPIDDFAVVDGELYAIGMKDQPYGNGERWVLIVPPSGETAK